MELQRTLLRCSWRSLQINNSVTTSAVNLYRRTFHISRTLTASKKDKDTGKKGSKEKEVPTAKKGFTQKKKEKDEDEGKSREDDGDVFVELVKAGTPRVKSKDPLKGEEREQYEKYRVAIRDHTQAHEKDLELKRRLQWEAFNALPEEFKEAACKPDTFGIPDSPYYWIATREVPAIYPPRRILY